MTLKEYRSKLINKVVAASSKDGFVRYLKAAINRLRQNKVHADAVNGLAIKTILNLKAVRNKTSCGQQRTSAQQLGSFASFMQLKTILSRDDRL
jgi:hypothetical protein